MCQFYLGVITTKSTVDDLQCAVAKQANAEISGISIMKFNFFLISAWDDDDYDYGRGGRRRGGYVKTHNKHKSSFNMAHSHEHGRESVRRFKREDDDSK